VTLYPEPRSQVCTRRKIDLQFCRQRRQVCNNFRFIQTTSVGPELQKIPAYLKFILFFQVGRVMATTTGCLRVGAASIVPNL
jgi:hypothetical protein